MLQISIEERANLMAIAIQKRWQTNIYIKVPAYFTGKKKQFDSEVLIDSLKYGFIDINVLFSILALLCSRECE